MLLLPQLQKSVRGPACIPCNLYSPVHTKLRLTRAFVSATSIDGNSQSLWRLKYVSIWHDFVLAERCALVQAYRRRVTRGLRSCQAARGGS